MTALWHRCWSTWRIRRVPIHYSCNFSALDRSPDVSLRPDRNEAVIRPEMNMLSSWRPSSLYLKFRLIASNESFTCPTRVSSCMSKHLPYQCLFVFFKTIAIPVFHRVYQGTCRTSAPLCIPKHLSYQWFIVYAKTIIIPVFHRVCQSTCHTSVPLCITKHYKCLPLLTREWHRNFNTFHKMLDMFDPQNVDNDTVDLDVK